MNAKKRSTLLIFGLVLCIAEVFIVQERTIILVDQSYDLRLVWQGGLRLFWDASVCALLVLTLHRNALALLFVGQFIFFNVVVMYQSYFWHPLSLVDGLRNVSESMLVAPHGASIIDIRVVALLFVLLLVKLLLVGGAGERADERGLKPDTRRRWVVRSLVVAAVTLTVGLATAPTKTHESLIASYGPALGYLVPTAFDAALPYSDRLLARAIEAGRYTSDRLTPVEAPLAIGDKFIILQVESLDWGVIDQDINGQPVAPFLRALRERSMFYKMEAIHVHGSADADFVAMMGRRPSPDTIAYYVDGYPYDEALPHLLRERGYATTFFHGVEGEYFSRRKAYSQMGFDRLVFEEEIEAERGVKKSPRSMGFDDDVLFDTAATALDAHDDKAFAFIITVTSHGPFNTLPENAVRLISNPSTAAEMYFNTIHFVDRELESFVDRLPKGTTLVIYGDHVSQVKHPGYDPGIIGRREFVPLYIHNVGEDLSQSQLTRSKAIATDGELNFIDVWAYLRANLLNPRSVATQTP